MKTVLSHIYKNRSPIYALCASLNELLRLYTPARSLRSVDQLLLGLPKPKWKLRGGRAFSIVPPNLWNNLPLHLRQASALSIFKTYFYSLAFDSV